MIVPEPVYRVTVDLPKVIVVELSAPLTARDPYLQVATETLQKTKDLAANV